MYRRATGKAAEAEQPNEVTDSSSDADHGSNDASSAPDEDDGSGDTEPPSDSGDESTPVLTAPEIPALPTPAVIADGLGEAAGMVAAQGSAAPPKSPLASGLSIGSLLSGEAAALGAVAGHVLNVDKAVSYPIVKQMETRGDNLAQEKLSLLKPEGEYRMSVFNTSNEFLQPVRISVSTTPPIVGNASSIAMDPPRLQRMPISKRNTTSAILATPPDSAVQIGPFYVDALHNEGMEGNTAPSFVSKAKASPNNKPVAFLGIMFGGSIVIFLVGKD